MTENNFLIIAYYMSILELQYGMFCASFAK